MPKTQLPLLDAVLNQHAEQLGADFAAYRNHAYRTANLCFAMLDPGSIDAARIDVISIAAAFHDLGIWTDQTFDYLGPSRQLAHDWLASNACGGKTSEIDRMILNHHKLTAYRGPHGELVEAFRRADWIDVTRGVVKFGVSRVFLKDVLSTFPDAGFHRRLMHLACGRLAHHPLNPLPMVRW